VGRGEGEHSIPLTLSKMRPVGLKLDKDTISAPHGSVARGKPRTKAVKDYLSASKKRAGGSYESQSLG
jgi:hypothetical protein